MAAANASDDIYWYESDLVGINEGDDNVLSTRDLGATIIRGPLKLPPGTDFRLFDICGRTALPERISPGIYFIESRGVVWQKIIKIQ